MISLNRKPVKEKISVRPSNNLSCEEKSKNEPGKSETCLPEENYTLSNKTYGRFERKSYEHCSKRQKWRHCRLERKWLVLIGSFYGIFCSSGFLFNMSVLFVEFLEEFQKTKAETSLIQAVCTGVYSCSGFITGSVIDKIGERRSLALGTLLAATGIGSSFFANGVPFLVISVGVVAGLGFSLIYIASYSIAPSYFKGRTKFLALGFISLASGMGGLFYPVVLGRLLETYHWREVLLIISGFILNVMVFSVVGKPCRCSEFCKTENKSEGCKAEYPLERSIAIQSKSEKSFFIKKYQEILSRKSFICFAVGMMLSLPCLNSALIFFIDFYEFNGVERSIGVWLYSGINFASMISRPIPGFLAQYHKIPKLAIPASFIFIGIIVFFLFPFAESVVNLAVLSCVLGVCLGGLVAGLPVNTLDIIGEGNYATAFGILMSGCGITNVVGGPVSGYFRDITGAYDLSFYVSSGTLFCSFLLFLVSILCIKEKHSSNFLDFETEIRRKSRRRSSLFPWKQSLEVTIAENTKL